MEPTLHLASAILSIPGSKAVTVASRLGCRTFRISEKGDVGEHKSHRGVFIAYLRDAVAGAGGVLVRQSTSERIVVDSPVGRFELPINNLYAVSCANGNWVGLDEDEVARNIAIDACSGRKLPADPAARYLTWPELPDKHHAH
jgi:hypothetical protein